MATTPYLGFTLPSPDAASQRADVARIATALGVLDATLRRQAMPWEIAGMPPVVGVIPAGGDGLPYGAFSRSGSATMWTRAGVWTLAAANTPRVDCDPLTGQPVGMPFEGPDLNMVPTALDLSGWGISNAGGATVTRTLGAALSPSGAMDATRLTATATGVSSWANLNTAMSTTVTGTVHAYLAKAGSTPWMYIFSDRNSTGASGRLGSYFDLATGALGAPVAAGGSTLAGRGIERLADDWWLCWVAGTHGALTSLSSVVALAGGDGQETFTHTGQSALVSRAMVSPGTAPTSFIPTTSGGVARAPDLLTLALSALGWTGTEGTIVASYRVGGTEGNRVVAQVTDGANNRIEMTAAGAIAVSGGSSVWSAAVSAPARGTVARRALAWGRGGYDYVAPDIAPISGTATVPAVATLWVGCDRGIASWLGGHITPDIGLWIFPRRLPVRTLQAFVA